MHLYGTFNQKNLKPGVKVAAERCGLSVLLVNNMLISKNRVLPLEKVFPWGLLHRNTRFGSRVR